MYVINLYILTINFAIPLEVVSVNCKSSSWACVVTNEPPHGLHANFTLAIAVGKGEGIQTVMNTLFY